VIAPPNQSDFEYDNDPVSPVEEKKGISETVWNRMAIALGAGSILLALIYFWIYINPYAFVNPYPPAVIPPIVIIPTNTPSPTHTITPAITATPTLTPSPQFTDTPIPSPTLDPATEIALLIPTLEITISGTAPTATGPYSYAVVSGNPIAISSAIMRPDDECKWMGVAGQVVDMNDAPVVGLRVQLYGTFKGKVMAITSLSGTVNRYGSAGYEIKINDSPVETYNTLWVQLFNQAGGAISDKVYLKTNASCDKNLIIVNFKQVK
jgi:hypothetical protein